MSRDITSGRSNRPRHRKVLYFPHRRLWIMEYSCKLWCKPCRCRLIPRQHSRHNWRLRRERWSNTWKKRMLRKRGQRQLSNGKTRRKRCTRHRGNQWQSAVLRYPLYIPLV
ncbi:hypothetical protein Taro_003165 [Colocasia esculenta]|uniref:Uncharacterized protein n=1 Tax=Colocasia esculenta TaxID=4460 RepID=A0A843TG86_COLES|nr:hypothetical protein [Colocasia esculenta]